MKQSKYISPKSESFLIQRRNSQNCQIVPISCWNSEKPPGTKSEPGHFPSSASEPGNFPRLPHCFPSRKNCDFPTISGSVAATRNSAENPNYRGKKLQLKDIVKCHNTKTMCWASQAFQCPFKCTWIYLARLVYFRILKGFKYTFKYFEKRLKRRQSYLQSKYND